MSSYWDRLWFRLLPRRLQDRIAGRHYLKVMSTRPGEERLRRLRENPPPVRRLRDGT